MNSYLTDKEILQRQGRARLVYSLAAAFIGLLTIYLLWALRQLLLPTVIGMVIAYISLPLIDYLHGKGFTRFWAIISLFAVFCVSLFSVINLAGSLIPDQREELELQVRVRYKIHEKFVSCMGLKDSRGDGNIFYHLFGRELKPLMSRIDKTLRLSDADATLFIRLHENGNQSVVARYWQYFQANRNRDRRQKDMAGLTGQVATDNFSAAAGPMAGRAALLPAVFNAISLWLVTPMVFLILLFDRGKMKTICVQAVPNRFFEMTLTIIDNINGALGNYLRGTATECFLVGTLLALCLRLVGVEMQWAAAIGIIAGLANAIPFLGPAIGLAVGILYAIMAEDIQPLLPFINTDNLALAILAAVGFVQLVDNAVFQPYVLGSAVSLHPLVVAFGVMGGAVLFGFGGMLFAIPAIVIVKVVFMTFFTQLRAYYII